MFSPPLPQMASLGEMLRYLRRRARLTQRELSIAVGYSEGQISRLENNERIADAATLQAVFVPALGIEDQPEVIGQLLALAASARTPVEEDVVAADTVSMSRQSGHKPLSNLPMRLTSFIGRECCHCVAAPANFQDAPCHPNRRWRGRKNKFGSDGSICIALHL